MYGQYSDLDQILAGQPVPAAAWRQAGIDAAGRVTLGECDLVTLEALSAIDAKTPTGLQFVTAAASLAVALAQGTLQEPEVRARVWERYAQRSRTLWLGAGARLGPAPSQHDHDWGKGGGISWPVAFIDR